MNTCFKHEGVLAYVNQESMKRSEEDETSEKPQVCYPETTPRFEQF